MHEGLGLRKLYIPNVETLVSIPEFITDLTADSCEIPECLICRNLNNILKNVSMDSLSFAKLSEIEIDDLYGYEYHRGMFISDWTGFVLIDDYRKYGITLDEYKLYIEENKDDILMNIRTFNQLKDSDDPLYKIFYQLIGYIAGMRIRKDCDTYTLEPVTVRTMRFQDLEELSIMSSTIREFIDCATFVHVKPGCVVHCKDGDYVVTGDEPMSLSYQMIRDKMFITADDWLIGEGSNAQPDIRPDFVLDLPLVDEFGDYIAAGTHRRPISEAIDLINRSIHGHIMVDGDLYELRKVVLDLLIMKYPEIFRDVYEYGWEITTPHDWSINGMTYADLTSSVLRLGITNGNTLTIVDTDIPELCESSINVATTFYIL